MAKPDSDTHGYRHNTGLLHSQAARTCRPCMPSFAYVALLAKNNAAAVRHRSDALVIRRAGSNAIQESDVAFVRLNEDGLLTEVLRVPTFSIVSAAAVLPVPSDERTATEHVA